MPENERTPNVRLCIVMFLTRFTILINCLLSILMKLRINNAATCRVYNSSANIPLHAIAFIKQLKGGGFSRKKAKMCTGR